MTGGVIWFTGLPASGKTTLAHRVRARLADLGHRSVLLDSDELRVILDARSYAAADRDAFYRSVSALAVMLAHQGLVVLVAATAPRRAHRDQARRGAPVFVEVWVRTPLEHCEARDPKGLYARARAGELSELPGVDAAYEPPVAPCVTASGGNDDAAAERVVHVLVARAHQRAHDVASSASVTQSTQADVLP